jgi:hypothetical protein
VRPSHSHGHREFRALCFELCFESSQLVAARRLIVFRGIVGSVSYGFFRTSIELSGPLSVKWVVPIDDCVGHHASLASPFSGKPASIP